MLKIYTCGSVESSDALVSYENNDKKLDLFINSKVIKQFGEDIKKVAEITCDEIGLKTGILNINDQGAIPATLKARIIGVYEKAMGENK